MSNVMNFEGDSETTLVQENDSFSDILPKLSCRNPEERSTGSVLLLKEIRRLENDLDRQIRDLTKKEFALKRAVKIMQTYDNELKTIELINKWRSTCQCGMSYMLNTILVKIDRMGGYQEYKRKEIEARKRQVEYQYDDGIQQQMEEILESPDFFHLPIEEKEEIRERMDEKVREAEEMKQNELQKFENELRKEDNDEMTLQELAAKLKVDYDMVYTNQ